MNMSMTLRPLTLKVTSLQLFFILANTDPASLHSKKSQYKCSPVYHVNMKDISSLIFICLSFDLCIALCCVLGLEMSIHLTKKYSNHYLNVHYILLSYSVLL